MSKQFEAGQQAILVEDGSRTRVEVLENRCNAEQEAYKVRVMELLCNRFDGGNALTKEDEGVKVLDLFQVNGFTMWNLEDWG